MAGTNDQSQIRSATPARRVAHFISRIVETLAKHGINSVSLLKPPPKADRTQNKRLEEQWVTIVDAFCANRRVSLHELNWELCHLARDGVHLCENGLRFLAQFVKTIKPNCRRDATFGERYGGAGIEYTTQAAQTEPATTRETEAQTVKSLPMAPLPAKVILPRARRPQLSAGRKRKATQMVSPLQNFINRRVLGRNLPRIGALQFRRAFWGTIGTSQSKLTTMAAEDNKYSSATSKEKSAFPFSALSKFSAFFQTFFLFRTFSSIPV